MAEEIEVKILNIKKDEIEKKLEAIGAIKGEEKLFKSISFDFPGLRLDNDASWVRLRDEGERITLAYKKRIGMKTDGGNDKGMEEIEVEVSDYEKTAEVLRKLGMIEKFSQEKKRTTWVKDTVHFDIDTWPRLDPYLEIEADSWEAVDNAIVELGLRIDDKKMFSATQVYKMAGINDKDYIKMTFDEFVKREPHA